MGKDGIIAEHPTLKLKYLDPEMARLSEELKEKLEEHRLKEEERKKADDEMQPDGAPEQESTRLHLETRKRTGSGMEGKL